MAGNGKDSSVCCSHIQRQEFQYRQVQSIRAFGLRGSGGGHATDRTCNHRPRFLYVGVRIQESRLPSC